MIFSITFLAASVSQYREQKILRRMLATPLRVHKFLIAQAMVHLLLSLAQATIILGFAVVVFGAHVYGNYLWLMVLLVLANIIFLNIGFIVAGLTRSVSAASGLANVIAMPLMFFSGTFFPTDSLPPVMSRAVQYLSLTPLLDALRLVALQAEPIWAAGTELAMLGGWVALTSLVAVRVFKIGLTRREAVTGVGG
jgi:ABC-2 type transport system permease protein